MGISGGISLKSHGQGALAIATAALGKLYRSFRNNTFAFILCRLTQTGTADEYTHLNILSYEVIFPRFGINGKIVRRKFRFGRDFMLLSAVNLGIEKRFIRGLTHAFAVKINIFLQRLADKTVTINIEARFVFIQRREAFGMR